MKLIEIKNWSDERLITMNTPDRNGFNAMITEELHEYLTKGIIGGDIEEEIDALCDITVFAIGEIYKYGFAAEEFLGYGDIENWFEPDTYPVKLSLTERITIELGDFIDTDEPLNRVNILADMVRVCYTELHNIGFSPDKCMDEVLKELNSRTGEYSEETKKWQKFKTPEAESLWYKANFANCILSEI